MRRLQPTRALAARGAARRVVVVDDFERVTLGPAWEVAFGGAQVQILDGDLGMVAGSQRFFLMEYDIGAFAADQWAEATISSEPTGDVWQHAVCVRRFDSLWRYQFGYDNDPVLEYQKWVFKYDGGPSEETRYFATSEVDTVNVPGPGDSLRLEVRGYSFRGYWKPAGSSLWRLMLEGADTDASKIATGRPGLAARDASGNTGPLLADTKVWASFAAGNL